MHENAIRVGLLAALAQVACGDAKPISRWTTGAATDGTVTDVAGGETSEFSGGDVPLGYCPIELSRTPLDLERADLAAFLELAVGAHEVPLRWRRGFPDDAIHGFEEDTLLSLEVTVSAAEDVVCSAGGGGGYEGRGEWTQRRFELGVALWTADGAVVTSFHGRFFPLSNVPMPGDRRLAGGATLAFEELGGALELGVDPELTDAETTFAVDLRFDRHGLEGTLGSHVRLPGPVYGDDTPHWSPVWAVFPAPDPGCEAGRRVALDEPLAFLGDTPRGAYLAALSRFPAPITGMWQDPEVPHELAWTELSLSPGELAHACADGAVMNVHASLHIETADGLLGTDLPVIVDIAVLGGQPVATSVRSSGGWLPRSEFEAVAGMSDLDLGLAEYGGFSLYQSFDAERDRLRGDFNLTKWEGYFARTVRDTSLRWCGGSECEQYFCLITAPEAACL